MFLCLSEGIFCTFFFALGVTGGFIQYGTHQKENDPLFFVVLSIDISNVIITAFFMSFISNLDTDDPNAEADAFRDSVERTVRLALARRRRPAASNVNEYALTQLWHPEAAADREANSAADPPRMSSTIEVLLF